ncbi:hypothetical protein QTO34_015071 [Cnephaeus nilssonii]|uniref:Large ribosomal subunit protein P1 n=1 Tax=Cnephaeus nilssonii TaxID=3371016 RepID=A0AA40I3I4_CNENI|nr:hypothetical protein QTO34_015071 [Eptesicus nilssonii]
MRKLRRFGVRPSLHPASSTIRPALAHTMAAISELTCIYSALTLHNNEVTVMENKINVPSKAAGVNAEPFWPGLFAKTLANVNIEILTCNVAAGGYAPAAGATPGGPAPSLLLPQLRRRQWKQRKKNLRSLMMTWALVFFD